MATRQLSCVATPRLRVPLSVMLNQQPIESCPLMGQVGKPPNQSLGLLIIVPKLGVPKPLLQPEALLDGFIKFPPKPLALLTGFAQHLA